MEEQALHFNLEKLLIDQQQEHPSNVYIEQRLSRLQRQLEGSQDFG